MSCKLWVGSRVSLHYINSALLVYIISSLHAKRSKSNKVIDIFLLRETIRVIVICSSLLKRRATRNKRGGEKDGLFLISVVPAISMVGKIFRPVTIIKREQNELKLLIKTKQKKSKNGTCLRHNPARVCSLFVFYSLSNTFACVSQSFAGFLHVREAIECYLFYHMHVGVLKTWFTHKTRTRH